MKEKNDKNHINNKETLTKLNEYEDVRCLILFNKALDDTLNRCINELIKDENLNNDQKMLLLLKLGSVYQRIKMNIETVNKYIIHRFKDLNDFYIKIMSEDKDGVYTDVETEVNEMSSKALESAGRISKLIFSASYYEMIAESELGTANDNNVMTTNSGKTQTINKKVSNMGKKCGGKGKKK